LRRLKHVATMRAGGTPRVDDPDMWSEDGLPWVSIGDMSRSPIVMATERRVSSLGLSSKTLPVGKPGILLFAMYASVGELAVLGTEASWNQAILSVEPVTGRSDPGFLRYWLEHLRRILPAFFRSNTQDNLNADQVANLPFTELPYSRQQAIGQFLRVETTRIDTLIMKKLHLIELLDERRVSLAHEMISGQSKPGPRRDSTLGWLGEIPAQWPLAPVGSQFHVKLGRMINQERAAFGDMRPYIRNINVRWDSVDTADVAKMDFPPIERIHYRLQQGDLLINEGGAGIGRSAIWMGEIPECYFQKSVLRLRPIRDCNPAWMVECMRVAVAKKVFLVEGNLATIPHVPAEALRAYRFPFPPRDIQDQLLSKLAESHDRDHRLRALTQRQVALLQERRQSLITAAVTGELAGR
jgi:type I restriction enzyme, S subunit